MASFPPLPRVTPPLGRNPLDFLGETYIASSRGMGLPYGKISLSKLQPFSTDPLVWQTDRRAIAYSVLCIWMSMCCRALKTVSKVNINDNKTETMTNYNWTWKSWRIPVFLISENKLYSMQSSERWKSWILKRYYPSVDSWLRLRQTNTGLYHT